MDFILSTRLESDILASDVPEEYKVRASSLNDAFDPIFASMRFEGNQIFSYTVLIQLTFHVRKTMKLFSSLFFPPLLARPCSRRQYSN